MTDEQTPAGEVDTLTDDEKRAVTAWLDEVDAHARRLQLEREQHIREQTCCAPDGNLGVVDRAAALEQALSTGAAFWEPNENPDAVKAAFDAGDKDVTRRPVHSLADLVEWALVLIANGVRLADAHIDPHALARAGADAGITILPGGWKPEAAEWKAAAMQWTDAYHRDGALLAAFDNAAPVKVVGPSGLQRRIAAWLAETGHGDAATAVSEATIETFMAV